MCQLLELVFRLLMIALYLTLDVLGGSGETFQGELAICAVYMDHLM